jgi:hypothetical protein
VRVISVLLLWSSLLSIACSGDDDIGAAVADATETSWSCEGTAGKNRPADGGYYVTSFGCWIDEDGNHRGDADDNCIPWCQGAAPERYEQVCPGLSGPECERQIGWYTADAHRLGCMSRVKVTNPVNGKAAVLMVLDAGPACWVEDKVDHWVLDMSYPASLYLFNEPKSATEKAEVIVEAVPGDTPLGPADANLPPFVGDTCSGHDDCGFVVDGESGACTMHAPGGGFCTVGCEGYCDDQPGKAGTFCVSFDEGASGKCMPKASAFNGFCADLSGAEKRDVERFVGSSGASSATAAACVPTSW